MIGYVITLLENNYKKKLIKARSWHWFSSKARRSLALSIAVIKSYCFY